MKIRHTKFCGMQLKQCFKNIYNFKCNIRNDFYTSEIKSVLKPSK